MPDPIRRPVYEYRPEQMAGLVPPHLREGLRAYVEQGSPTGDGLRRLLSNDPVAQVVAGLDDVAQAALPGLIKWLYNHAPGECWGSRQAVVNWRLRGGLKGRD